ncbi:MAG: RCC1 domain-containing protein, partial [Actinomycetes bacterium]
MRRAVRAFVAACSTMALVGALAVVGAVAESTLPTVRPAAAVADVPAFEFTPLANPCRLVDTRAAGGSLAVGATRSFLAKGSSSLAAQGGSPTGCGVPTTAGAVEIAVTAVSPSGAGFLRLLNADAAKVPDATFVNYTSGVSITNTGTVPIALATSPHFTVANFGGTTQVVVDVLGYFLDSVTAGSYTPLSAPCRAVDTRSGGGPLTTGPAASRSFQIAGTGAGFLAQGGGSSLGCGVPSTATAAVLSITAVAPVGTGFLRIGPNSGSEPAATVVNYTNAVGITNTGAVPRAGTTADITLKNFGTQTDVVVDVLGYYRVGTGTSYRTVVPCRAVDTRFAPGGGVESGTTRLFQVAGPHNAFAAQGTANTAGCGVPDRAAAVAVSVTAVTPSGNGFARLFPAGGTATGTFLNFTSGRSVTNSGALPLANGGVRDLALREFSARSDFVVDVLGYYEPPPTNPDPAGDLSVGSTHSCRLAALQTVVCWGYGGTGERGTPLYSPGPTPALGVTTAVATASGRDHSCALLADRSIQCWGANDSGQLGNGTTVGSVTPVTVQGITTAVALNASDQHTCALLADRSVRCWGFNERGQLGDGTTTNRSAPVTVTGLSNAAMLTSFREHVCALRTTGTVSCWGANNDGQLGDGTLVDRQAPTAVTGLTGAVAVSAGGGHTCALLSIGTA